MTPREFEAYLEGWTKREEAQWQRTRLLYSIIYNTHSEQMKTPEELIPLPSDNKEPKEVVKPDYEMMDFYRKKYNLNAEDKYYV